MVKLTAKSVEAFRGATIRREIPDSYMRNLYLIVQPSGTKSWAVRYRQGGKSHKLTIGPFPAFDLKTARDSAAKALRAVSEGRDPKQRLSGAMDDVVAQFLAEGCKHYRPRSRKITEQLLNRYLRDWRGRSIESITRADVKVLLGHIDAPIVANRVHSLVGRLFNWCIKEGILASSPVAGLDPPSGKETPRERVLSHEELHKIWHAAPDGPFGAIVRFAILTGQRRTEISEMQWSEIDGDTWVLPGERTKNGKRHEVPLSRQAKELLEKQPRISDRFVFSYDTKAFAGFSKAKARLDEAVGIHDWVFHDLRRTVATGLAALGISIVVTEKILNHISGSLSGVAAVYQRHEYGNEKRVALQKWADHLENLVQS